MKLYRVIVTTGTPQDRERQGYRVAEVLYCGYDRHDAAQAYYASRALDFGGGNYTGGMRETKCQSKEIAEEPARP